MWLGITYILTSQLLLWNIFGGLSKRPSTFNILTLFYHFHGKLSIWKMLMCTLFIGVSEKVCFVHSFKCWQLWTAPYNSTQVLVCLIHVWMIDSHKMISLVGVEYVPGGLYVPIIWHQYYVHKQTMWSTCIPHVVYQHTPLRCTPHCISTLK